MGTNDGALHTAGISWKESDNTLLIYIDGAEQVTTYTTQSAHSTFGTSTLWQILAHGGGSWDGEAFVGHNVVWNTHLGAQQQADLSRFVMREP